MTESTLKIKVDSTDVKTGTKSLDDLAKSGKDADKSTKELTSSSDILANSVKALAASYAVLKVVQYAREAAMLSARYETLGVSMRIVGNNAGYTSKEMEAAAKTMQATGISMLESRNQAVRLVQAHIDLSNASKLARIAQDAAVIGNINSSEAFAKLIHGIQTGQTEVLKTIGLNISMENSYKILAEELGVTVSSLDQTQKTTAILNAVFERGSDIAGTYEASMGTAGKQINSLARYQENLKLKLGETFDELLIVAVMGFTTSIKDANGAVDDLAAEDQLKEWGRSITDTFAFIADSGASAAGIFKLVGTAIGANIAMTKAWATGNMNQFSIIAQAYDKDLKAIIDSTHHFRDATAESRTNMADSKAAEDLKQVNKDLEASIRSTADAMKSSWEEGMINAGVIEVISEKLTDYIADLENEQTALKMSTRDQAMYNAELDALAYGAGPKAVQTVRELAGANFDLAEATKETERALNDAARASERAHRQMQQDFSRSMDRFGSSFADLVLEGDNAFDALAKSWERMLIEMAGQEIFKTLLGDSPVFNVQGGSGNAAANGASDSLVSSVTGGVVSSAVTKLMASGGLVAGAGQFAAGMFGTAVGTGSTIVGAPTAAAAAGAGTSATITTALAAIPVWGWALIAAGVGVALFNNDDGKKRENAGFLVGPTPGADPNKTFGVDPFASGLNIEGFARRASQETAIEVIDTFRDIDFAFVEMIATLDGTLDLTNATLAGLDEEATAGSSGTFVGLGGNGDLGGDITAQINSYIEQLVNHVGGLDESLISAIQSAADADAVFSLLAEEIAKRAEADAIALPILKEKNKLQDQLDSMTMTRIELIAKERATLDEANQAIFDSITAIESLGIAISAQLTLDGAMADARSALRAVGDEVRYLFENSLTAAQDVERAQQRITDLNRESADSMRAFAKTIDDFLVTLSPASYGQNLEGLKAQLTQTAGLAADGDLDAQSQLISQAQGVVRSAESSSATRADFFRQEAFVRTTLLGVRDAMRVEEEAPGKSKMEVAEEELSAALAIQVLADAAYSTAQALTASLAFGSDGPLQNLFDSLANLSQANANVLIETEALAIANADAGIILDETAEAFRLTNEQAGALSIVLGLTGTAATDFINEITSPTTAIQTFIEALSGLTPEQITGFLGVVSADQIDSFLGSMTSEQVEGFLGVVGVEQVTAFLGAITETQVAFFLGSIGIDQITTFLGTVSPQQIIDFLGTVDPSYIVSFFSEAKPEMLNQVVGMFAGLDVVIANGMSNAFAAAMAQSTAAAASAAAAQAAAQASQGSAILSGINVDGDYSDSEIFKVIDGLNNGLLSIGQVASNFNISAADAARVFAEGNAIQGFANGGAFGGGLRIVGENGPELESTGPSRIFNNSQTKEMFKQDNSELVAELRALRMELSRLQGSTDVTASATARTNQLLEQITFGEMSLQTRAA